MSLRLAATVLLLACPAQALKLPSDVGGLLGGRHPCVKVMRETQRACKGVVDKHGHLEVTPYGSSNKECDFAVCYTADLNRKRCSDVVTTGAPTNVKFGKDLNKLKKHHAIKCSGGGQGGKGIRNARFDCKLMKKANKKNKKKAKKIKFVRGKFYRDTCAPGAVKTTKAECAAFAKSVGKPFAGDRAPSESNPEYRDPKRGDGFWHSSSQFPGSCFWRKGDKVYYNPNKSGQHRPDVQTICKAKKIKYVRGKFYADTCAPGAIKTTKAECEAFAKSVGKPFAGDRAPTESNPEYRDPKRGDGFWHSSSQFPGSCFWRRGDKVYYNPNKSGQHRPDVQTICKAA